MTTARSDQGRVLFLCEDAPIAGLSGASSYNSSVLDALVDLDLDVEVLVTTPRLHLLRGAVTAEHLAGLRFLHAIRLGGSLLPVTISSAARLAKHRLLARRTSSKASRRAVLGRQLRGTELRSIRRRTRRRPVDLLVIDTVFRASAIESVGASRTLLAAHDVFAARAASFRANGFEVSSPVGEVAERAVWASVDAIAAITEADAQHIQSQVATPVAAVHPVVASTRAPVASGPSAQDILFVGAGAYHNVDGLTWFLEEVWPAVHQRQPSSMLRVVGSVCDAVDSPPTGVQLLGRVDDLRSVAASCRLAINPVRMGSGLKIKMVDYFSLGLPCVVTPIGAEGFPLRQRMPFVVADGARDTADVIARLLNDDAEIALLRSTIPSYLDLFSRTAAVTALRSLLVRPQHAPLTSGEPDP